MFQDAEEKDVLGEGENEMKDFIIVMDFCDFCPELLKGIVLADSDVDLLDVHSGDPRINALEKTVGEIVKARIPTGVVGDCLINYSRDPVWMKKLFEK